MSNRQYRLARRPTGRVSREDFEITTGPVPSAGEGEIVAQTLYLSLDPTNRLWIGDTPQYMPPVEIGEVMRCVGLARVVESRHPDYAAGDLVIALVGWQDYALLPVTGAVPVADLPFKLPTGLPFPLPTLLGALGTTGATAYFGLLDLGKPAPGQTVVVSAAAGAVGSVAGQIAKIKGCRAVGIAGTREKCAWLTGELGFDAAICYRDPDWREQLSAACPDGIDVNFENVGGEIMTEVMSRMNLGGRVVVSGLISAYNSPDRAVGPFDLILFKRLRVEGFIVIDFFDRLEEVTMQLGQWMAEGKLVHKDTIVEGLGALPEALNILFDGGNVGKLLVKVAD